VGVLVTAPALIVLCDTREQTPPPFPDGVVLERATLKEGDYTTLSLLDVARIERKSAGDFSSTLSWGRERFDREVDRLACFRWRCIVVEGELGAIYRIGRVHPHAILGSVASLYARHDCPTFFALNAAGAGRLIAGILRRWEERVAHE
jgi:ERCC4-type nuclease